MERVLSALHKLLLKIHDRMALVCGFMFFIYMLNIVGDVTGRYLFSSPILGTIEIGENVLAIAVFMALAGVQARQENIRVTLLQDSLPPKVAAWLDVLALLSGLLFVGLAVRQSLIFAQSSLAIHETGINISIPLYIGKLAFFVGCTLLCVQFAYELCRRIYLTVTDTRRSTMHGKS